MLTSIGGGPRVVARAFGAPAVTRVAAGLNGARLRILAYHDVPSADAFAAHVEEIAGRWAAVSGEDVARWLDGDVALPPRAVWVTFDDGSATVVENALPALERHHVPATVYVCPSAIEGPPLWWQVIEARPRLQVAVDGRLLGGSELVRALKLVDDGVRRDVVDRVAAHPPTTDEHRSVDRDQLRSWRSSGREIGNHTWDHPMLTRCTPEVQTEQVRRAHEWLHDELGEAPDLFAYPNGDHTPHTAAELARLGYRSAPLFDHHLVGRRPDRYALPRLRIGADVAPERLRAILSGLHSGAFHVVRM